MAKLDRVIQKIFGSTAPTVQVGKFGSLAAGLPETTKDPTLIQSLSNYLGGWYFAVLGNNSPAIEDMNAIHFLYSYQLAYGFQAGVAEWLDVTTYYIGSIVNIQGTLYKSISDDNINNDPLTEEDDWSIFTTEDTGVGKDYWGATAPRGWIFASGRTIGSAASGATERAAKDTIALFTLFWDTYDNVRLPIQDSAGVPTVRGASALVDFNDDKRLTIIDKRGYASLGKDDMGGTSANRITTALDGDVLGDTGGTETQTITIANMPAHNHGGGSHTHDYTRYLNLLGGLGGAGTGWNLESTQDTGAPNSTVIASQGSGTAHNNTQPSIICNYILKL